MNVGILGAGAVGTSVATLAGEHGHTVTGIADSTSSVTDPDGIDVESALTSKEQTGTFGRSSPEAVLDGSYDVLVEATPTTLGDARPAFDHVRTALERDRHVVLANKGPVAQRYADLRELEQQSAGTVRFDAAVCGAIPVLPTIRDLGTHTVTGVQGILNGTANFVLSRMAAQGLAYDHVLSEAQALGVAEADPSFDVEGTDAALKCVILANILAEGDRAWTLSEASVTGIRDLPASALEVAGESGRTIRLIGTVREGTVRVAPRLLPEESPLAVEGTQNIVQIETAHAGTLSLSGRGAGGPETASAVLADIGRLPAPK